MKNSKAFTPERSIPDLKIGMSSSTNTTAVTIKETMDREMMVSFFLALRRNASL